MYPADSGPGVFLVRLRALASGMVLWEVGPPAKTEILVPLYFWPYEELYISNYNQTINFIGVGGSSFGLGYHILRDLGLLLYLGGV